MNRFTPTYTQHTLLFHFPPSTVAGIGWAKNRPLWQQRNTRPAKVNKPGPGTQKNTGKKEREGGRGRQRERCRLLLFMARIVSVRRMSCYSKCTNVDGVHTGDAFFVVWSFGSTGESNFPHQSLRNKTNKHSKPRYEATAVLFANLICVCLLSLGRKADLPLYLIRHVFLSYQHGRNSRDLPGSQETLDTEPSPEDK